MAMIPPPRQSSGWHALQKKGEWSEFRADVWNPQGPDVSVLGKKLRAFLGQG